MARRDDSSQELKLILIHVNFKIAFANCPSQITASKVSLLSHMVSCVQVFCVRGNCN